MLELMSQHKLPVKVKYSPEFRRIYCTGSYGTFNGIDFRIGFFTDIVEQAEVPTATPTAMREVQAEVIITPFALKRLRDMLDKYVKEIEKSIGEIKMPERPGTEPTGAPYL